MSEKLNKKYKEINDNYKNYLQEYTIPHGITTITYREQWLIKQLAEMQIEIEGLKADDADFKKSFFKDYR